MAHRTVLPWVANGAVVDSPAFKLAKLIGTAGWQKRKDPIIHPLLMAAAQIRAEDMALKEYYSHTSPSGVTPNEVLRSTGYPLPSWYPTKGNNIESITRAEDGEGALSSWLGSEHHYDHVTAATDFYRGQRSIGVGVARDKKGKLDYWVFLSAPGVG